ncbi:beta strand repeat-containing protein [Herbaspirillum sp. NPDC087042]|uniref:beta strand repeat-containing protein n=1 Tax=Herbaspirillum sp. NPDC087042 TaxID=3364004 RepID=UPI003810CD57
MTPTSTLLQPQPKSPPVVELLPPSMIVRVGRRRLTLSWRARKPLPQLLAGLLRRSWRSLLAPALRISIAAAAVCGAWQAPVLAAAPAAGTLPTGWSVINGNVTFTQNGTTLNINQLSPQAIAGFVSFSIGSGAAVNISQPSTTSALLAKVSGGDISQIYGRLSANGTVVLYNPNGVVVGPSGTIDAGRFIATSLAISDSDFLAGKLNFASQGGAGLVDNQGTIQSATGGSVYLIGANVSNSGVIRSPQGEVILAAGQTVTLADTATPGVTVNVTGSTASVTNLGSITAEAGRIGVAAGLITNSGVINASSVVREGGRIFLRASQNLTTTASSNISADGTSGGNISLVAQNQAFIDGDVSATGAAGQGGYVETSGLKKLDVVKVPKVGSGGSWLIDPYDLQVVAGGASVDASQEDCNCYAVSSSGSVSQIGADTITGQLNAGVNVTLATGAGGSQAGNITVSADIAKTGNVSSTLTLNAANNISINANITSTNSTLGLTLHTGAGEDVSYDPTRISTIGNGARVLLNGGTLNVWDGIEGSGNLSIANGTLSLGTGGALTARSLQVGSAGTLTLDNAQVSLNSLSNDGTVRLASGYNNISVANSLDNNGTIYVNASGRLQTSLGVNNNGGGQILFNGADTTFTTAGNGQWVNNGTINVSGSGQTVSLSSKGGLINNGNLSVSNSATLLATDTGSLTNNGTVTLSGGTLSFYDITNNQNATIAGNGTLVASDLVSNNGNLAPGGDGTTGNMTIAGNFSQGATGVMMIDIAPDDITDRITFTGASVNLGGTLKTRLLANYVPTLAVSVRPLLSTNGFGSSYFRYVTGDVVTANGAASMFKAVYGGDGGLSLSLMAGQNFYAVNSEGGWGSSASWQDANGQRISTYLPTQVDTVVVNSSVVAVHDAGNDVIGGLQVNSGGELQQQAGNLTVSGNSTIAGTANVSGGALTLNGVNALAGSVILSGGSLTTSGTTNITGTLNVSAGNVTLNGNSTGNGTITIGSSSVPNNNDDGPNAQNVEMPVGDANVTIANASQASLNVQLNNGNLTLAGGARFATLNVANGTVTGNTGSQLSVSESFTQTGGTLTLADAALSQSSGALAVGNISANHLVLEAQNGNITQNSGTSLHVTTQLLASASTGISLNQSGNQIAGFAAYNRGTGDITLTNHLNTTDASVVTLNGLYTARGNITVDNTGGMATAALGSSANFLGSLPSNPDGSAVTVASRLAMLGITTNGQVKSANGSVSLVTHSPLTIGGGGVSASGNIVLTAGSSNGTNDNLVVNGVLVSLGGNITLSAGDSMTINANISTSPPGVALLSVDSGAVIGYAQGVSITDANGTRIPVPLSTTGSTSQTDQAVQQQQNQQTQNLQSTLNGAQLSDTAAQSAGNVVQQNSVGGQTVGGTSGNFGDEGSDKKQAKKPLPMCT